MYGMFKDNHLPYLDMEDFLVMWQSLMSKWTYELMMSNGKNLPKKSIVWHPIDKGFDASI